jgi:hypothetical protein
VAEGLLSGVKTPFIPSWSWLLEAMYFLAPAGYDGVTSSL